MASCVTISLQQNVQTGKKKTGAEIWTSETFEPKDEEVLDFKKSLQPTDHLSGENEPKNLRFVGHDDFLHLEKLEISDTNFIEDWQAPTSVGQSAPKRRWQRNNCKALLG